MAACSTRPPRLVAPSPPPPPPCCPVLWSWLCIQASLVYYAPAASINWLIGMIWEPECAFPPKTLCHLLVRHSQAGKNKLEGPSACTFFLLFLQLTGSWRDRGRLFRFCSLFREKAPIALNSRRFYSWQCLWAFEGHATGKKITRDTVSYAPLSPGKRRIHLLSICLLYGN